MNDPSDIPPSEQLREGSAWQGRHKPHYPEASVEHAPIDLALNAWLGRMTGYVSPAALAAAWQDWAAHLLLSPSKQMELGMQALTGAGEWLRYSSAAMLGNAAEPVRPLAQDKRFSDPLWHAWPYNQLSQGFLLTQKWWHRATTRRARRFAPPQRRRDLRRAPAARRLRPVELHRHQSGRAAGDDLQRRPEPGAWRPARSRRRAARQ
jgi:hypothetical protein